MPGMPYHLEKGPLLSVMDDFFNTGPRARLVTALSRLRAGDPLTDIGPFDSPNLYSALFPNPYKTQADLVAHFNDHWLGIPDTGSPNTGHWQFYKGPVEDIMRETLIRAMEVALGVPHDPFDKKPVPTRHWPIDFWWKCPQPWFEGWVSWRQGSGCEKVTVIFATPADDGVVLRNPAAEATPAPVRVTTETEGSWLISAKTHGQHVQVTVVPTGEGIVVFPTMWTVDVDDVVTLVPKFGSGGARDQGMPYTGAR